MWLKCQFLWKAPSFISLKKQWTGLPRKLVGNRKISRWCVKTFRTTKHKTGSTFANRKAKISLPVFEEVEGPFWLHGHDCWEIFPKDAKVKFSLLRKSGKNVSASSPSSVFGLKELMSHSDTDLGFADLPGSCAVHYTSQMHAQFMHSGNPLFYNSPILVGISWHSVHAGCLGSAPPWWWYWLREPCTGQTPSVEVRLSSRNTSCYNVARRLVQSMSLVTTKRGPGENWVSPPLWQLLACNLCSWERHSKLSVANLN